MSVETEFDLGSLTWVKGELDNALAAASAALAGWNAEDSNPLKAAAAHLHQVYGALQIVDLQGVSQVANETERLLAEMVARDELRNHDSAEIVLNAIAALKSYLDALMSGAAHTELKLAATLQAVMTRRGAEAPAPSELFYPDTSVRTPREVAETPLDDAARNQAVRGARLQYQKGLLQFLQNKEPMAGLMQMHAAVSAVEKLAPGPAQYTFWWTAAGLMEALRRGGVPTDFWLKRLCGRIDMQMRRLMEGSRQLADRLFRDVLFYVAQDTEPSGRSAQAKALFELAYYFPAVETQDDAEARAQLSLLRDNLGSAKDHWIRYCAGRTESLQPFQHAALALFEAASRLPNSDMQALTRIVQAVAKRLPGEADATQNEALQLEMATALLLAQNAAEHFAALNEEFTHQASTQAMRLQAAIDPQFDTSTIPAVAMLDEISRAAQEKLVVAQVTQEIQANLNQVEEILDRFFRDTRERAGLPMVPNLMKQILGALNILQLDVAADLVREAIQRIAHFTEADTAGGAHPIAPENLNWVAEALSTLGVYLDALRHGRDDNNTLTNLLAQPEVVATPEVSVESQIRADTDRIKESVQQWATEGGDAEGRAALKSELGQLARDADLVGDAALRSQADAAMKALDVANPAQTVIQAVQDIGAAAAVEAPAPSAEAVRLAAASDADVDEEMLSTFIEEAHEVIGNIIAQVARLNVSPYDSEAFTSVRRSFHTLKGSGRMVGLSNLAEPAWEIEQTLNTWLRDEKVPSSEMLDFLESAANIFLVWVSTLEEQGRVQVESGALINAARKLRGEAAVPESPPPKAEAGVAAQSGPTAGEEATGSAAGPSDLKPAAATEAMAPAPMPTADVDIDGHLLPAELFDIFTDEATQRLADLDAALAEMAQGKRPAAWEGFIRAAHTLAGISRTTGFMPLAEAAHAVELWAGQWPDKTVPLTAAVEADVAAALDHLAQAVQGILARHFPAAMPEVAEALALTHPQIQPAAPSVESVPVAAATEPMHEEDADAGMATLTLPQLPVTPVRAPAPAPVPAHDELDEQLLPIFLEEAAELLPRIGGILRQWRGAPDDHAARDALKRALHTLKGSARMAGAMRLGEAVHSLETQVIERGEETAAPAYLDTLEAAYDHFTDIIEHLKTDAAAPAIAESPARTETADGQPAAASAAVDSTSALATAIPAARLEDEMRTRQSLRLKSDIMDTLLNEAGEVAIARARIENVLTSYKQTAQELAANVDRLRSQLRELEIQAESQMHSRLSQVDEGQFDPLEFDRFTRLQELTRLMAESVNDVSTAQDNLLSGLNETDNALQLQSRMTRNLQQELMHIRMVPLSTLAERLYRVVRQTAKDTGHKAQMELDGGQTEMDRAVLDKIAAPLEHMVRNAVAHGIELPETRIQAGKAEYGELRLSARQEGNEIVITLADDGAGIDVAAVRAQAEARGWLKPGEAVSPEQVEQLLFRSGFSTAKTVTEVAGRGVGLDVVKNEIAGIGGRVKLETEAGKGARFTIRLPLTLALTQVVLARAGGQTWALPASLVTLVREFKVDQLQALHEIGFLELNGEKFPLRTLAELVGRKAQPGEGRYRTVLLLHAGAQRLALRIDALEGNFEAVVKNIGPQLARLAGISGATVLGDGRVALIVNPFQLAERAPEVRVELEPEAIELAPLVMVVDDSLTVRKITTRFLQREGYRVITARDGVEALEMLEDEMPAVMLLDIEMPRMDGYEVVRHVRAGATTRELPIIMITSRTADKHRSHALEAGVDGYMGKPYQEEELLSEIQRLAGQRSGSSSATAALIST
jgi:chemosensory pili system protein ChpA (sensor histidine kinase/response regulator)